MKLREIAHARAGDKGNIANIVVIAYDPGDFAFLAEHVTLDRLKTHFADILKGDVRRYELPALGALNFVLEQALAGGVTRSLSLDPHGKALSSALLEMEVPDRQCKGRDADRMPACANAPNAWEAPSKAARTGTVASSQASCASSAGSGAVSRCILQVMSNQCAQIIGVRGLAILIGRRSSTGLYRTDPACRD